MKKLLIAVAVGALSATMAATAAEQSTATTTTTTTTTHRKTEHHHVVRKARSPEPRRSPSVLRDALRLTARHWRRQFSHRLVYQLIEHGFAFVALPLLSQPPVGAESDAPRPQPAETAEVAEAAGE